MFKNFVNDGNIVKKQILINPTTGIVPVARADKNNKTAPTAGTYQQGETGDILCYVLFKEGEAPVMKMIKIKDGGVEPLENGFNYYNIMKWLNPLTTDWLLTLDDEPFLPAGVGWDGKYSQSDLVKKARISSRLPARIDQVFLERMINAGYFTSTKEVNKSTVHMQSKNCPLYHIKKKDFDYYVLEQDGIVTINEIICDTSINVHENTKQLFLIKFNELKVKGNEQFQWEHIVFLHEVGE